MSKSRKRGAAIVVFVLGCLLPKTSVSLPTVKYEFSQSSPNVVLSGGSFGATCTGQPNLYWGGSTTISFTDPQMGGNPVTFQTGYACSGSASTAVTVNAVGAGNMPLPAAGCCAVVPAVESLAITTAYNNAASTKTIAFNNLGMLLPFSGNQNMTDPVFRVTVTLIPGVSTPAAGGFTNSTLPLVSWPPIPNATSYTLQINADPFFNSPLVNQLIPGTTQYQVTIGAGLVNAGSYYTRVKAQNGTFAGIWSYIGDFTVAQTLPTTPANISPPANATVPVQTPTFNWTPATLGTE